MSIPQVEASVREVYEKISTEFSRTRYKMWKCVREFLASLPPSSLVADVGCGNGKNMLVSGLEMRGFDTCKNFIQECTEKGLKVSYGDVCEIPAKDETFDAVICIAVIHHLATEERRLQAIRELLRITVPGGKILITVWKCEDGEVQDRMVSWTCRDGKVFDRYYHFFTLEEIQKMFASQSSIREECGNWIITVTK